MTTREDARDVSAVLTPAERSAVAGIRGLRWWVVVLVAAVLAIAGVSADLLQSGGEIGIFYTVCFPVGAIMAAVWVRRGEIFATCVQPPLLLALAVPVAVVASGSLPRAGGLTAVVLAVGGPMINGFPTMAITTAVCLAIAFVRTRLQPLRAQPDVAASDRDRADRARADRERADRDRARADRDRADRDRADRDRADRDRAERDRGGERPARPADRRPDDRRPDDRRPDDRRPDDRRGASERPASRPDHPDDPPRKPSRRPADTEGGPPGERGGEGFGPGVYRVPRPPQQSRPGGRPGPDAPRRPSKRPPDEN